jgi:hypothetical protein
MPIPAMTSWRHSYCFHGTPLLSERKPVETLTMAIDLLRSRRASPTWWALTRFVQGGPVDRALLAAMSEAGVRNTAFERYERPVVRKQPNADSAYARTTKKYRKTLQRRRRRLAEEIGVPVVAFDAAANARDCTDRVEDFLQLETAGWKGRTGTAMACDEAHAELFRRACRAFHDEQRLQLWVLEVAGRPAAYQCNFHAHRTSFSFKITYDEALARYSPGVQLDWEMIADFQADHRLALVDSCAEADVPSVQHLPDRQPMVSRLLALHGPVAHLATRLVPTYAHARDRLRTTRRRTPEDPRAKLRGAAK